MSELNFPTILIRLTKATLTIVMCCATIQNDCSECFETRQGSRQGDVLVLSTLLFNVVLEVIVRRANRHNLQQRNTTTRICRSAVRDAYLAVEREAAKVGLKINEQKTK
jgi:hypothetical protein